MNEDNESEPDLLPTEPCEWDDLAGLNGHAVPVPVYARQDRMNGKAHREPQRDRLPAGASIDAWCFIDIVAQRWRWLALGGCALAVVATIGGMVAWKKSCTAVAQMMRYEPMGVADFFKPAPISPDTFAGLLKSPELLERVSAKAKPPISAELLAKCVYIKPQDESDVVLVGVKGKDPQTIVNLANLYTEEAVRFTRDLQQREVKEVSRNYLKQQLAEMDQNISTLEEQFKGLPSSGSLKKKLNTVSDLTHQIQDSPHMSLGMARLNDRLAMAIDDLSTLTKRYTDAHPLVQAQREHIAALEHELSGLGTNGPGIGLLTAAGVDPTYDIIRNKLMALDNSRQLLADRQREAEVFAANPPGNIRTFAPATIKGVIRDRRWLKIGIASVFGGVLGMAFGAGAAVMVEFVDNRLKTADDVKRVTRLPVIAALEDLRRKGPAARERWAFRTWTMLQGRLSPSSNQGLVCGITSSEAGEGRSTWINLLAEAASMTGFRVLTIATRPTRKGAEYPDEFAGQENGEHPNGTDSHALTTNVLSSPGTVTDQLVGPNPQPVVHIPLPGWVWNRERRVQWREALDQWRKIENVVILVELPPASRPEAVLLGENLPNLLWLTRSGAASAAETRAQLETLRHARCKLVGAVLNDETIPSVKRRFPRWLSCLTVGFCLITLGVRAQETNAPTVTIPEVETTPVPVTKSNGSFSVVSPAMRGEWQKRLTLGPGDVLTFSLYGEPELTEPDVFIGPDGRVGFLEAQNVMAAGLTVDELRTNIDRLLANYRRAPRTVITPVLYQSKKYYILGKVVGRGVYTLDRPITIVEAVARAHGLEIGLSDRNTLELADFQRSFLMRRGKRFPINFEKLFGQGDLSQNIALEPDDYLYFPSAALKEVYVLGEVRFPGVVSYTPELTVIAALAARGGFNDRAYKSRVLIIRGSLSKPQTFVTDTRAILDARGQNFKLEPKDVIFVSSRPFIRGEELLDLGITAFIQSAVVEATGIHVITATP